MQDIDYFMNLSGNSADRTVSLMSEFKRLCKSLNKINEDNCNLPSSARRDKREQGLLSRAAEIAKELSCKLHHTGDPRGHAIRLIRPDGRYNCWDGETWAID